MTIIVSEDLNSGPRSKTRFCATVQDGPLDIDWLPAQAGFGANERSALWSLAQQLGIHPGTIQATAIIERVSVR